MKPFPWRSGMRTMCGLRVIEADLRTLMGWRVGDGVVCGLRGAYQPDPTDGATKGALLDAVREVWGEPGIHLAYCWVAAVNGYLWVVADHHRHVYAYADTEFAALEAARQAAP